MKRTKTTKTTRSRASSTRRATKSVATASVAPLSSATRVNIATTPKQSKMVNVTSTKSTVLSSSTHNHSSITTRRTFSTNNVVTVKKPTLMAPPMTLSSPSRLMHTSPQSITKPMVPQFTAPKMAVESLQMPKKHRPQQFTPFRKFTSETREAEYVEHPNPNKVQPPPPNPSQQFDPNALEELLKSFDQLNKSGDLGGGDASKFDPSKFNFDQFKPPAGDNMSQTAAAGDAFKASTVDVNANDQFESFEEAKPEEPKEKLKGDLKSHSFQTETRQMLDIVTNSLYTDKEVFLRELVSNASDALEKARYLASKNELQDPDIPLEVRIFADPVKKTITIQDTGIGMTGDELVSHLGTIARSGSKQWVKDVKDGNRDNIIGQFGVGFYSGFMVGEKMEVYSRSGKKNPNGKNHEGHYWVSDGTGSYELAEAEGVERGTKIVIHLRENSEHFGTRSTMEAILKKYSNFVGYPIYLDGARVNTIQAIWNMSKNEVTEEQYAEFYRYIANAYDTPTYRMHFNADLPIQINALFYFPERHTEKYGMGRMDPGTSLYSRKVLIKSKAQGLLPDYLRFVQGVVDSEDIPLNISRENMQDSLLISRISSVLTKRVIKHLQDEAKKDPAKYVKWYNEFGTFIREGICSDFTHKNELARLLRFDSSSPDVTPDTPTSLDDYISRLGPGQDDIYYLCAPNRRSALASPYYEALKNSGHEVLFLYHPLDDFAMQNLREFGRRKLVSAESTSSNSDEQRQKQLEETHVDLVQFLKDTLKDKVSQIVLTDKVATHPAFIVDHESATMRKMIKMMDSQSMFGETEMPLAKQKLQVNPTHPIFTKLMMIRDKQPTVARTVVEQVFDNALMAADLLDNPRDMLPRMHRLMEMALDPTIVKEFSEKTGDDSKM